jgi:hypothetical protein
MHRRLLVATPMQRRVRRLRDRKEGMEEQVDRSQGCWHLGRLFWRSGIDNCDFQVETVIVDQDLLQSLSPYHAPL